MRQSDLKTLSAEVNCGTPEPVWFKVGPCLESLLLKPPRRGMLVLRGAVLGAILRRQRVWLLQSASCRHGHGLGLAVGSAATQFCLKAASGYKNCDTYCRAQPG